MPLLEFFCNDCKQIFEQLTSDRDPDKGQCPTCAGKNTERQISAFRVAGRGDLRETTIHGCHDCDDHRNSHDHGHSKDHHHGHDHKHDHGHSNTHSSSPKKKTG